MGAVQDSGLDISCPGARERERFIIRQPPIGEKDDYARKRQRMFIMTATNRGK